MAKTVKSYRLSERTIEALKQLKKALPKWTETEIVETAIQKMADSMGKSEHETIL